MSKKLSFIFEEIQKNLKLARKFEIRYYKRFKAYWVFYNEKLMTIVNNRGKSYCVGSDLQSEIYHNLVVSKILVKKRTCKLRIKHEI